MERSVTRAVMGERQEDTANAGIYGDFEAGDTHRTYDSRVVGVGHWPVAFLQNQEWERKSGL